MMTPAVCRRFCFMLEILEDKRDGLFVDALAI